MKWMGTAELFSLLPKGACRHPRIGLVGKSSSGCDFLGIFDFKVRMKASE
jgi:hypothetical protein